MIKVHASLFTNIWLNSLRSFLQILDNFIQSFYTTFPKDIITILRIWYIIVDPVNDCPIVVITYVHRCTSLLHQCSDNIKRGFSNSVEQGCFAIAVSSVAIRTVLDQPPGDLQLLSLYSSRGVGKTLELGWWIFTPILHKNSRSDKWPTLQRVW